MIHAESRTKEVADRYLHAGIHLAVPIHAQDEFAQVEPAGVN